MGVEPLDGDTRLACSQEAAEGAALRRVLEIRVRVHDHRAVATQLQRHPRRLREAPKPPADRRAAREREHLDSLVLDEPLRELRPARDDADGGRRCAGLEQDAAERQRRKRRLRGRPDDAGAPRSECRTQLVGHKQERCVEGRDRKHRSDWEAPGQADAPLAARYPIDRNELPRPADPASLVGREGQDLRSPLNLETRLPDCVAGLERHLTGELVLPPTDELRRAGEDLGAPERRDRGDLLLGLRGGGEGPLEQLFSGQPDLRDLAAVVGEDDGSHFAALGRHPREQKRLCLGGQDGHRRASFFLLVGPFAVRPLRMIVRRSGSACHQRSHSSRPIAICARCRTMSWCRYSRVISASTGFRVRTALAAPCRGMCATRASSPSATSVNRRPPIRSDTIWR